MPDIQIPVPALQIDFSFSLDHIRQRYLQEALSATIEELSISTLDAELSANVPQSGLKALARRGLRGELVFPVPCLLEANPYLLGYYRLLLGFSQKEFYTTRFGVSGFKAMETKGLLSDKNRQRLPRLCEGLIESAVALVEGIGVEKIRRELLNELTLLTLGPQLRGGANVKKGAMGILAVFDAIHGIVKHAATQSTSGTIEIINAAGRAVFIEFAPDPDIVIYEAMSKVSLRRLIAIEVKGGTDFSNIHNRVGEAEKSHQKAKAAGYVECWTVVNVDSIDMAMAKRESPSSNRFYRLSALNSRRGEEYEDFKNRVLSLTGIRSQ